MLCYTFTTGTEKQFVADDYYLQLYKGTVACAQLSATLLAEILSASSDSTPTLYVVSLCIMVLTTWQACCTILNYDALCPLLLLLTFPCCTSAMCMNPPNVWFVVYLLFCRTLRKHLQALPLPWRLLLWCSTHWPGKETL